MNKILYFSELASSVWKEYSEGERNKIKKYFHLRPTNNGITIVSTLPIQPMRGITGLRKENDLRKKMNKIVKNFNKLTSINKRNIKKELNKIGFPIRKKSNKTVLEEEIQAIMIRNMSKDENLRKILKSKEQIRFIASEFAIKQKPGRIDIIGFNEKDLYIFEIKRERTKNLTK